MVSKREARRELLGDLGHHIRPVTEYDHLKTPMMRRVERQFEILLEDILRTDRNNHSVGRRLDLHYSTVSKWRKKLGL